MSSNLSSTHKSCMHVLRAGSTNELQYIKQTITYRLFLWCETAVYSVKSHELVSHFIGIVSVNGPYECLVIRQPHSFTHTSRWKCEIQWLFVHESLLVPLCRCGSFTWEMSMCVHACACACINLTTPSLLSHPDEWLGTFQLFVTAVWARREIKNKEKGTNLQKRGVKDTIMKLKANPVKRKYESTVCSVCVWLWLPTAMFTNETNEVCMCGKVLVLQ